MGLFSDALSALTGVDLPDIPDEAVNLGGSAEDLGSGLSGLLGQGTNPGDYSNLFLDTATGDIVDAGDVPSNVTGSAPTGAAASGTGLLKSLGTGLSNLVNSLGAAGAGTAGLSRAPQSVPPVTIPSLPSSGGMAPLGMPSVSSVGTGVPGMASVPGPGAGLGIAMPSNVSAQARPFVPLAPSPPIPAPAPAPGMPAPPMSGLQRLLLHSRG